MDEHQEVADCHVEEVEVRDEVPIRQDGYSADQDETTTSTCNHAVLSSERNTCTDSVAYVSLLSSLANWQTAEATTPTPSCSLKERVIRSLINNA